MSEIKNENLNSKRFLVCLIILFLPFFLFTARLVDWQIINADQYRKRAQNNSAYLIKTSAPRGEIVDKDGEGIVVNSTGYRVIIDRIEAGRESENYVISEAVNLLEILNVSWRDTLPIIVESGTYKFSNEKESQVLALKKYLRIKSDATAEECMEKLIKKFNCENFSVEEKRIICSVRYNTSKSGGASARAMPYILADDVSREVMSVVAEYSSKLKGLRVEASAIRTMSDGYFAPHIIGYTGSMSSEEYEKYKETYSMDELIGKTGIEKIMEKYLRGKSGKRILQRVLDGHVMGFVEQEPAIPGNTVYLTISSKLQKAANKSLETWIAKACEMGVEDCRSGAVVVLNVKDFSVLAASTYPSYDLNRFIEDSSYYSELVNDKEGVPLLNRAFNGSFAPGSVYKPLIATAALQENLLEDDEKINCSGGFSYYKGYTLKCMGKHGSINVLTALEKSCNVFFAELGRRLGAERIKKYANRFGLGVLTGIELPESTGIVAGPEHSKLNGTHWYESGASQAAIGQSDNMFTPIQLATFAATIANNGNRFKTYLIKKVVDHNKNKIIVENSVENVNSVNVSDKNIQIIKEGMRKVVTSGTARVFADYPIEIAAKTGTAQNSGSDHTIFVCFAPYENPEIAMAVVIANGKHGVISKGVARDVLNSYFGIEA